MRKKDAIEGNLSIAGTILPKAGDEVYLAVWSAEEERFIIDACPLEVETYEDKLLGLSIPESLVTITIIRRRQTE